MAWYRTGTASVVAGDARVTGDGTIWRNNVVAGDAIMIGAVVAEVADVVSNGEITLAEPWSGATAAATAYGILPLSTGRYVVGDVDANLRVLMTRLEGAQTRLYLPQPPTEEQGLPGYFAVIYPAGDIYEKDEAGWSLVGNFTDGLGADIIAARDTILNTAVDATAALDAAAEATAARDLAEGYRDEAEGFRDQAGTSAASIGAAETNVSQAETRTVQARDAAVTAQGLAEDARDQAQATANLQASAVAYTPTAPDPSTNVQAAIDRLAAQGSTAAGPDPIAFALVFGA